ncbi:glycosyltransferase [Pedobacter sp. UBA4863]|uniref:glycosyltransferase family 2 protein n=1 Tax=Pedobacter sp. UBA4863 TaxID=1947060 RepID=UPI0025E26ECC|nr:glycosyltransferase [Pedobacter sp. UBA4863]
MHKREVSVIMPSYNSERFIRKAIESVLKQTYKEWELIIIDDYSTDYSRSIIEEFCKIDTRIKLIINSQNMGVAESRNLGMKNARFDYISFLDSDDVWHEKKLELQCAFMQDNNSAISFTQYYRINANGSIIGSVNRVPDHVTYQKLLNGNVIAMSTSMFDARLVDIVYFDKIGHEDYLFWLKMLKTNALAKGLNHKLMFYRVHSSSLSSKKFTAVGYTWRIYRNKLKFNWLKSAYYFTVHEVNAIKKRLGL